jgi:hypothetical protein
LFLGHAEDRSRDCCSVDEVEQDHDDLGRIRKGRTFEDHHRDPQHHEDHPRGRHGHDWHRAQQTRHQWKLRLECFTHKCT